MGEAYRVVDGTPVVPPAPSPLDLHSHSDRSDGVLSPDRLAAEAAAAGVRLLALTDHDTLAGLRSLGTLPPGLEVLPGVEINAVADGVPGLWEGELHILGLGVDPNDDRFEATLARQRDRRAERFERIVRRLDALGMPVGAALEAAGRSGAEGAALGRPTLARALVAAGHAESVDDAMRRILARGRPGYEPRSGLGPVEAIRAVRAAGGLAVLAHFSEAVRRRPLLEDLRAEGLGGLEVHYARFPQETVEALGRLATSLGLIATGGSDHHGDGVSYAESHARLWVPPALESPLRDAIAVSRAARSVS